MGYIILYSEKYGYSERFKKKKKNGYPVYTHDFHFACNYNWLDRAMQMMEFLNARYGGGHHIEVFSMEG